MGRQSARLLMSMILIGLGVVILLSNLGLLPAGIVGSNWFAVVLFTILGGGFLVTFLGSPRGQWWAAIPAFTLLGLAYLVGNIWPASLPAFRWLGAAVFLGMIGLSFIVILLVRPDQWWAIFPGGALLSVAGVVTVSGLLEGGRNAGLGAAAVLFLGLAVTFFLVFLRPVNGMRMVWALWPAGILAVIGVLLLLGFTSLINYIWAVALILIGVWIISRGTRR